MEWNGWHARVWRGKVATVARAVIPTGFPELDRVLPGGGWPLGALTEILVDGYGIGELGLLMPALEVLTKEDPARPKKWVSWIAPPFVPYAPALQQHGINVDRLLMIHPTPGTKSRLWAIEQAVRSGASAGVLAWVTTAGREAMQARAGMPEVEQRREQLPARAGMPEVEQRREQLPARAGMPEVEQRREQLPGAIAEDVILRRLQLAAEDQGCWVLLFRPVSARLQRSPAALRIRLTQTRVEIIKCRGGRPNVVDLDLAGFALDGTVSDRAMRS